ncbi:SRPBCC domain-containing protein [Actinoplanes sp. CA-015351]|uniref:SRPBCC domain-containing protein n=1 Tax=Actinoplanes sp. CA-015351 TaxID=3239897 RepID=UPI003D985A25
MYSTQVSRRINAPRALIYSALLSADAIARWRVPVGMTSVVHEFDAREGGAFRVSLTYDLPDISGKSAESTDTYHGHFVRLVVDEQVVETLEFETADESMRGTMTITTTLVDSGDGTEVTMLHEGVPDAISPADNEAGTRMALDNLATLTESP